MLAIVPLALAAALAAAPPALDTVMLLDGGRVRGTVIVEDPRTGVTIQIPGGETRTIPAKDIFRIEYRDGPVGGIKAPGATAGPAGGIDPFAAPPPPPPPPGQGAARGPPVGYPPEEYPGEEGYGPAEEPAFPAPFPPGAATYPPDLMMFSAGIGMAVPTGSALAGASMSSYVSPQFLMEFEAGVRIAPPLMVGLVLDLGLGTAGSTVASQCAAAGTTCSVATLRFGPQLRWSFTPSARATPWIAAGTMIEGTSISDDNSSLNAMTLSGWEMLRLSAGYDFRQSQDLGWGLFLSAGVGSYTQQDLGTGPYSIPARGTHVWIQGGVRMILFP